MRLLIVGTLGGQVTEAAKIAISRGAKVAQVDDIATGMNALRSGQSADLIMVDVGLDIGALVVALKAERIHVPVVACGIGADAAAAVRAIKAGAKEYLPLPPNAELIAAVLEAVTEESSSILFRHPLMRETLRLADQVAATEASVLICGESGTGKELFARYLHRRSRRADRPMVSVNCAAIPENLLESELFGYVRGAFTGAVQSHPGMFEQAHGGTLFLDEIGELPLEMQAKLLRVLENGEYQRVGETASRISRARVIAASNRDLRHEVRQGRFRADLYHRLSVFTLGVPPLREMDEDRLLLLEHFRRFYAEQSGVAPFSLDAPAERRWLAYAFPGNVRELRNIVIRLTTKYAGGRVGVGELEPELDLEPGLDAVAPPGGAGIADGVDAALRHLERARQVQLDDILRSVERGYIEAALRLTRGNVSQAARLLGVNRTTLYSRMPQPGKDE